jgi:hypothetical protein
MVLIVCELLKFLSKQIVSLTCVNHITRFNRLAANDKGGAVDIDAITEPRDALSKQLLHLGKLILFLFVSCVIATMIDNIHAIVAADAALEDCLYYLEKALLSGAISKDDFFKVMDCVFGGSLFCIDCCFW